MQYHSSIARPLRTRGPGTVSKSSTIHWWHQGSVRRILKRSAALPHDAQARLHGREVFLYRKAASRMNWLTSARPRGSWFPHPRLPIQRSHQGVNDAQSLVTEHE